MDSRTDIDRLLREIEALRSLNSILATNADRLRREKAVLVEAMEWYGITDEEISAIRSTAKNGEPT